MTAADVMAQLKEAEVKFVDFRFTDTKGKEQHVTVPAHTIDDDVFEDGKMFDGSSITGWKGINESDMILMPDPATAVLDVFTDETMMNIRCNVVEPSTMQGYDRCPRSLAERAQAYLESTGIADAAYFGPENEFFVFDNVSWDDNMQGAFYKIDSDEGAWNTDRSLEEGNMGHRPTVKGGYFPVPPVDSLHDIRGSMCLALEEMGLTTEVHHHEVATAGQCEIGVKFNTLVKKADEVQILKYVVMNVAHGYGKTATFMPKPIFGINGSGMHVHQSLWKDGNTLFYGDEYANLSQMALWYIGGILKNASGFAAITNPLVNSYKRLVPGYEAPTYIAWSASNRSALVRIPASRGISTRTEVRCPDPACNPYLALAMMLNAGLDGVRNKLAAPPSVDVDIFEMTSAEKEQACIASLPGSLEEAIITLKESPIARKTLGEHIFEKYIEGKTKEWDSYRTAVTDWEINRYIKNC